MKFQGKAAMVTIAVASFVIIIAVAVSGGFRHELRKGVASLAGDIQITSPYMNFIGEDHPVTLGEELETAIGSMPGVDHIVPAVYRAGIIKSGSNIHGVVFKGIPGGGDSLRVKIPERLSAMLGIGPGDRMLTYFIGDKVKARQFTVESTYDDILGSDDNLVVYAGIEDMRRVNGWDPDKASAIEVILEDNWRSSDRMEYLTDEIGAEILFGEGIDSMVATSAARRYPQIFSWLDLIDFNVLIVLVLMVAVAGFNMISSLLIMLFRNISVIGTLKAMGMTDRQISAVFLRIASSAALKGMLAGNILAFLFCIVQNATHFVKLDPANYFVSAVPVHLNALQVIGADLLAYILIMLLLLLPCLFVSRVDPAKTVRVQ
ncbi:MAG: FtsX-like permease family protein [Candidatus Cryptobacteroides sp.]|nr:FtsX-like permease family protein [Bacteroidales bacterium]MDD7154017.1 FtsX-like permease family protein [Bacteroidales bacterium]MDY5261896.1 FtsX-like permease family protein [Candidatus Cryptobacteroides sp.]MDY5494752.1 FtsX-like permease family protein [Candidatus Cryptobacteroides sp.]